MAEPTASLPVLKRVRLARARLSNFTWGEPRFTTLVDNGPSEKRLDVAIMGDGYAATDMPLFYHDVDTIIEAFRGIEPIKSYWPHFNFHRVDIIARQSGVTDIWSPDGPQIRRSPLGTFFSPLAPRRLVGPDRHVWRMATRAGVPWDSVLVVVNTPRRGGATLFSMGIGYASRNSHDFPRIMIHESGHSIAKLMDEYIDPMIPNFNFLKGRSLPNALLPFANVTLNGRQPRWQAWVADEVGCPTNPDAPFCTPDTIGTFEGAAYTAFGAYRPTQNCMMRSHSADFCPVCQEQWIKRIYRKTAIADGFAPAEAISVNRREVVTFSAEILRPEHIATVWRTRGPGDFFWHTQRADHGYRPFHHAFDKAGQWDVELQLEDHDPKTRKPDVRKQSRQSFRWRVTVEN